MIEEFLRPSHIKPESVSNVFFELNYGLSELPEGAKTIRRRAARAVIRKDESVLMILTNKGDFKFPGGGFKDNETAEQCLKRELLEETGYSLVTDGQCIGRALEQNPDKFEEDCYFSMLSEYYLCIIDDMSQAEQVLDDYEREQDFKPVFVDVPKAVENNENLLNGNSGSINQWVKRETDVLKQLLNK